MSTTSPAETLVAISGRKLTAVAAFQLLGRCMGIGLGVLAAALLARGLGPSQFGHLALALTLVTVVVNLGDFGISQIALRDMSAAPEGRDLTLGALMVARWALCGVGGAIGAMVLLALLPHGGPRAMGLLVMASVPLAGLSAYLTAVQARLRGELTTLILLFQSIAWLAVVALLTVTHASLGWYGLGFLVVSILHAAALFVVGRGLTRVEFAGAGSLAGRLLRRSWPLGVAGLAVTLYYKLDSLLVYRLVGSTANGEYAAAYRFLDVLQMIPMTVAGFFLPLYAQAHAAGLADRQRTVFESATLMLAAVAFPIVTCGVILAPDIVHLVYGARFHASAELLAVLLPTFISMCLGYLWVGALVVHNVIKPYAALAAVGAAVNVALNVWLLPLFGVIAAAWISVASEALVTVGLVVFTRHALGLTLPVRRVGICAIGALIAGAVALVAAPLPLAVTISAATACYVCLVLGSRVLATPAILGLLSKRTIADA